MYYTGVDPVSGRSVYVPRGDRERRLQKGLLLLHLPEERARVCKALQEMGRADLLGRLALLEVPGAPVKQHRKKTPH
jgi:hypothetical protein